MQSYPFTSQVTYDEQDLPIYDRAVDSAFLREVFAQYFSDGVFYKPTSAFQVTVGAGMNVLVNPGACHIRGAVGIEKSQRTLAIQAAETMDRIDTVVLRLDLSLQARSIDLFVVKGTASTAPQAPALTRDSTVWELGLANIFVAKNTSSVTQQRITDTRLDNTRCGVVAQTIGELDTSPYFEQVQAMIEDLEDTIQGIEGGSGYVFSLEGESGHLTLADVGAVPESEKAQPGGIATLDSSGKLEQMPTAADVGAVPTSRTVNGKALSSNISLTAADVGAKYILDILFSAGSSPRTAQGNIQLNKSVSAYQLIAIVTCSASNAYTNTFTNIYLPVTFQSNSNTWMIGSDSGAMVGSPIRFMTKDGSEDGTGTYCYVPQSLGSFGIKSIYGLKFNATE